MNTASPTPPGPRSPVVPVAFSPTGRAAGVRGVLDLGFVFLLFATVFGSVWLTVPLLLFAVIPLFVLSYPPARAEMKSGEWRILGLMLFYPVSSLAALYIFPGDVSHERAAYFRDYYLQLYVFSVLCIVVGYLRGLQMPNFFALFRSSAPWFILISFVLFLIVSNWRGDICLAAAWTGLVIIPAISFITLVFLSLIGWSEFRTSERLFRVIALMLAVMVVVAMTGRRGIFLAMLLVMAALVALSFVQSLKGKLPGLWALSGALAGGLALSAVFQWYTGCSVFGRMETIFRPVVLSLQHALWAAPAFASEVGALDQGVSIERVIDGARDVSIALRLQFYLIGIENVLSAPLVGHGLIKQLDFLAEFNETHMHSQFLTWLVTGGIVRLVIGCVFLALPFVLARSWSMADRILVSMALTGIWGASLVTDSLLEWHFFMQFFCLLLGLIAGVSAARARLGNP